MSDRDPLDRYWTPDALAASIVAELGIPRGALCLEPHVGGGAFARALLAAGCDVVVSDIDPDAPGLRVPEARASCCLDFRDFAFSVPGGGFDWVVGNPPFRGWESHVDAGLLTARCVAYLLPLGCLEGQRRLAWWRDHPPDRAIVLPGRPRWGGPNARTGSPPRGHAVIVWSAAGIAAGPGRPPPALSWLP